MGKEQQACGELGPLAIGGGGGGGDENWAESRMCLGLDKFFKKRVWSHM